MGACGEHRRSTQAWEVSGFFPGSLLGHCRELGIQGCHLSLSVCKTPYTLLGSFFRRELDFLLFFPSVSLISYAAHCHTGMWLQLFILGEKMPPSPWSGNLHPLSQLSLSL